MKEIITEVVVPKYVTVQRGTKVKKLKQYQAEDGKIFDNKEDAERYDSKLEFGKIEHLHINNISELGYEWYRAKDENELKLIKERLTWSHADVYGIQNIKIGEWFNYSDVDGGDSRDSIYFITLAEFIGEVSQLIRLLKG